MSQNSAIEWTQTTWNPIVGCSKCSPGCAHCYALPMSHRLAAMGQEKYAGVSRRSNGTTTWTGHLHLDEKALGLPETWKQPRRIFVNSMSDLFHESVPAAWICRIFDAMQRASWHTYQILTKRSRRLAALDRSLPWIPGIWMGVSIECKDFLFRADHLRQTGALIKFLSLEPLLGPLPKLNLSGIDWVIVGGESGPGARFMKPEWVLEIRDQCVAAKVPFFFKQWGGRNKKLTGRLLDGRTWDEIPAPAVQAVAVAATRYA